MGAFSFDDTSDTLKNKTRQLLHLAPKAQFNHVSITSLANSRKQRKQRLIEFHMSQAKLTYKKNVTNHDWEDVEMLPVGPTFENDADHVSAMSLPVSSHSGNDKFMTSHDDSINNDSLSWDRRML